MANKVEDLVNVILDSYNECDITARIDEENTLNKDILIEIIDEIRKVLFPGFFDNNKVRSEYLKFLVGERLEFIQYHLKKQVSNAFANQDVCRECSKAQAEEKAEEVVFEFLKRIPKIREYLNTEVLTKHLWCWSVVCLCMKWKNRKPWAKMLTEIWLSVANVFLLALI